MTDDVIPLNEIGKIGTVKVYNQAYVDKQQKRIEELEKENANVKEALEGYKKIAKWCDKCDKIAELEKENAELKAQLESERDLPTIAYMQGAEKQKKKDEEELKKWKDEWQEQVQKATDEGYARTLQTMQLTKAKELLKRWVELSKPKLEGYPIPPIQEQTEQFLKE